MTSQSKLYFEDFTPGRIFNSGSVVVDAGAIKAYAAQFDPQPFHLDEESAKQTFFKGLAASGWHTVSMTMRLLVDGGLPIAGGLSAQAPMKSAGRAPPVPAIPCGCKAKCWKRDHRSRDPIRD